MKIGIYGMGHLGRITAACVAKYHPVVTVSCPDIDRPFSDEPGLIEAERIHAANIEPRERPALSDLDLLWITIDTPLDAEEKPQWSRWHDAIYKPLTSVMPGTIVLISSQVRVGTTRQLAGEYPDLIFAISPENIRHGRGMERFTNQARIVYGAPNRIPAVERLLQPFGGVLWMSWESAEMSKHALNAYLATMIVFGNEIAAIARKWNADPVDVEAALLSEERVSPRAPLKNGGPFTGGHLARELHTLMWLADSDLLFSTVYEANQRRL